jgi:hypothetical protein
MDFRFMGGSGFISCNILRGSSSFVDPGIALSIALPATGSIALPVTSSRIVSHRQHPSSDSQQNQAIIK